MLQKLKKILKEQSWKALVIHTGLMVLVFIVVVIVFFYLYLPSATLHGETITVPNLKGMALDDMDEFLKKRNLNYEVFDSLYDQKYPPLSIYTQYPLPGANVKENRKIYLTVIKRTPDITTMPNLMDGSLKNAELFLDNYGLKRGKITYVPFLGSNVVLEQWYNGKRIEPGATVEKGSFIDLVVGDGLGQRTFNMPRFVGLPIDEADFSIRASGLNTGSVIINVIDIEKMIELVEMAKELEIDTASIIESGHVFMQRPEIGAEIRLGAQVDLWVVSLTEEDSLEVLDRWLNKNYEPSSGSEFDQ
jgi:eukaryotic-like serine/threonine-protein kinase